MIWRDHQPLACSAVDVFGMGDTFSAIEPWLAQEGIAVRFAYDDTRSDRAFDADVYGRQAPVPALFCIAAFQTLRRRWRRFQELRQAGVPFASYVAPGSVLVPGCRIGNGSLVYTGAILGSQSEIGDCVFVNLGCLVSHHVRIGDNVTTGPGVRLAGHSRIGPHVFLGTSATVIDHVTVGEGAIVAAGAVVTADVPPQVMVAGVPAVVKKELLPA